MASESGGFLWYELITPDPAAAERFYGDVIGWTFASYPGMPEGAPAYRIVRAGETGVAGLLATPEPAAAMPPSWFAYLHVADVDAAVGQALAEGATIWMPAADVPGVGRIAMLADPQGVAFYVMTPFSGGESRAFSPHEVGHIAWNELATTDLEAGLGFYLRQFGWTRGEAMPMGDLGDYVFLHHHGAMIGAAMGGAPDARPAGWLFYIHVADIEATPDRIRAGGGVVAFGPAPVPGGSKIVIARDPQGASFGLVGPASAAADAAP